MSTQFLFLSQSHGVVMAACARRPLRAVLMSTLCPPPSPGAPTHLPISDPQGMQWHLPLLLSAMNVSTCDQTANHL